MASKGKGKSLWQESMRSGVPELDEERRNVMELLELLEVRPLCSVASDDFASRFARVQAATEKLFSHEEALLLGRSLPLETKRLHLADHEKIRAILSRIGNDAARKKNQTALDVYKSLRAAIERHVAKFGLDVTSGAAAAAPAGNAPARKTAAATSANA